MITGTYHADSADCPCIVVAETVKDGDRVADLVVFANGSEGSGLDGGANLRRGVKSGTKTGDWSKD